MELNEENVLAIRDAGLAREIEDGMRADFAQSEEFELERWNLAAVAAGIAHLSQLKAAFSVGKNTLVAVAAGLALTVYGDRAETLAHLLAAATVVYLVAVLADELVTHQVIALVSRTPLRTLLRADWDLRLLGAAFRYLATLGTLVVLFIDPRLLPALPALVLSLHLAYTHRVRGRAEQQAWQRLARTTDALNVIDLDRVLATAVHRAGELFSADQVEIELTGARRTVQGSGGRISYDGPSTRPAPGAPVQIETRLRGADGATDVGILRLRFHRPVLLSERERYTLRTFAAALCTAVCNAQAYAELARAAHGHAHAAGHDALTGLPNRRTLLERGEELLNRPAGRVVALLLIDLVNQRGDVTFRWVKGHSSDAMNDLVDRLDFADVGTGGDQAEPPLAPPGADETARTNVLEAGAALLQDNGPLAKMDVYVVGFHPMKDDPSHQMEAHHFCRQVNEDFAQCALFDGNGVESNLTGVEYIISEKLFEALPAQEQASWHPHNGEILSGQLVAPNLPEVAEKELMRSKMNSYGKTWHTWHTRNGTQPGDTMPVGPAMLAWSFSRDGEVQPELVAERDRRMDISTAQRRADRADLVELARPQAGVDALRAHFPDAVPIPGVSERAPGAVATGQPAPHADH